MESTAANSQPHQSKTRKRPLILVVDDDFNSRDLVFKLLTRFGYEVIGASSGQQGIDMARLRRPGLLIMDIAMPVLDGMQTTRLIRADPELKDIPVIALTAHAMQSDAERALAAGCSDYLSKPYNLMDLVAKVRAYLSNPAP